jgi:predicted DNA binding protein
VWHPDCWTLQTTGATDAGLIARGLYTVADDMHARFTAYGEADDAVEQLVSEARESPLTDSVRELHPRLNNQLVSMPGRATRELLVEYPDERSIYQPFVSRGFVPDETVDIRDGREYWTVVIDADRDEVQHRLDGIRSEMDAEIEVRRIISSEAVGSRNNESEGLSHRQTEVLRLACRRGYYEWPRQVTAADLAVELDISKATLLEHLRKAEAKVLSAYGIDPE